MQTIVDFLLGEDADQDLREKVTARWRQLRIVGTGRNQRGIVATLPNGAMLQLTDETAQQVVGQSPTINFFSEQPANPGMPTVGPSGPVVSFSPGDSDDAGQE